MAPVTTTPNTCVRMVNNNIINDSFRLLCIYIYKCMIVTVLIILATLAQ